ncbi:von Willebrand factor A domain-containing protein 5A-like isoform X2 [Bufo gargarizans]|uniref:von Willebrand factor A domain-containing protein 5A-like isoform X2 n=1 Tax=Bufo gargarizans TaxID=30331 RepID=UPI001CF1CCF6|nr:von Willebrand factor A domain-containing protein 5A-like isoform X2 [Bufo gargarizans]
MPLLPPCCGLIVVGSKLPVPLKGISVDIQVKGFVADVSATLKYKNEEEKAVEAIFVFPMDEDSAVYSFEAKVEGKIIVADLQEKEQAHKTYDEAISQGQQAFLLEEDKSSADVFSCNVGNLPPGQEAEVTLKYVRELPVEADGAVRFVLPAVLNPRYTPKDQPVSVTATRPQVPIGEIPYTLSLRAHFQSVFGIVKIVSNCDISPVEYTNEDKTAAKVSLAEGHKFERDVELLAYYSEVNKPSVTVEAGTVPADAAKEPKSSGSLMTESVAMLNFYPSFPAVQEQINCGEFIFVVDRSGSMNCAMNSEPNALQRIDSAKETLVLLLKSLPLGCYFNIFGFGSHFESFFTESKEYTQQSMEEAVKKVNEMKANFGGTEILRPLKKIYDTAGRQDHPRQLFLFTDGEVGNTKEVIDEVQKNSHNHRCFAFGIGEGASTSLIKGMARAGSGTFEFITGKDRMQTKVLRALKCSLQPTVKNVSLTWSLPSGMEAILLSKVPTAIFQGQRSIVYAQLKGKAETKAEGEVCLQYNFKDELLKNTIRFPLKVEKAERPTIHRLAAKSLISELECGKDSRSEDGKKRILEVSLQSGVISSLTAFVAVNKDTKTPVEGPPVQRDIPAPGFMHGVMYHSFGSSMPLMGSGGPLLMGYRSITQRRAKKCNDSGPEFLDSGPVLTGVNTRGRQYPSLQQSCLVNPRPAFPSVTQTGTMPETPCGRLGASRPAETGEGEIMPEYMDMSPPPAQVLKIPPFVSLISLQNADGSWNLTPEFCSILGISEQDIINKKPDQNMDSSVWATVLAVIWLHASCLDQREEWELLEGKAISWLKAKAGSSLDQLVRAGNDLLKSSVNPNVFGL